MSPLLSPHTAPDQEEPIAFSEMLEKKEPFEVARLFLATLQLVGHGGLTLPRVDRMDRTVTLFSVVYHTVSHQNNDTSFCRPTTGMSTLYPVTTTVLGTSPCP